MYVEMMKDRLQYLFRQYYHDRASRKELEEFFHLVQSAKSDAELQRLLKEVYGELSRGNLSTQVIPGKSRLQRGRKLVAAILIIGCCGALAWFYLPISRLVRPHQASSTLVASFTTTGQQKQVRLGDGSEIWLNVASKVYYPDKMEGDKRELWLSGEAYFDVQHAKNKPFIIHVGDSLRIHVLGTSFNVKAYPNGKAVKVAVKSGKVKVELANRFSQVLTVGEEALFENTPKRTEVLPVKKIEHLPQVGSWQRGIFQYEDVPLEEVAEDLQRIYGIQITLNQHKLRKLKVTTAFQWADGPKQVLNVLCHLTDARLKEENNRYIIY